MLSKTKPGVSRDSRNNFAGILIQFLFLFPSSDWEISGLVEGEILTLLLLFVFIFNIHTFRPMRLIR